MAKIAKLQKEVDGVLNTIYPSTITEAVINIESSKSLKDELTDINNKIPTKTSDITNDSGYITKDVSDLTNYSTTDTVNQAINNAVSSKVDISSISTVATSGDYNDLNNKLLSHLVHQNLLMTVIILLVLKLILKLILL